MLAVHTNLNCAGVERINRFFHRLLLIFFVLHNGTCSISIPDNGSSFSYLLRDLFLHENESLISNEQTCQNIAVLILIENLLFNFIKLFHMRELILDILLENIQKCVSFAVVIPKMCFQIDHFDKDNHNLRKVILRLNTLLNVGHLHFRILAFEECRNRHNILLCQELQPESSCISIPKCRLNPL